MKIVHFLGGVVFAVVLIALLAIAVLIGTLVESKTESHLFAMQTVYQHPLFTLLLFFLFVNILLAALRRWPFKTHHVPFLLTHLGLLLVIGGVMAKNLWGLQGVMTVWEGEETNRLAFPYTYSLHLQDPSGTISVLPLEQTKIDSLSIRPIRFLADTETETLSWIDGEWLRLHGMPPLPVLQKADAPFPEGIPFAPAPEWAVLAIQTDSVWETAQAIYKQGLSGNPTQIDLREKTCLIDNTHYSLDPPNPLPLSRTPLLLFLHTSQNETFLFAFDPFGHVFWEQWEKPDHLISYDHGFSGYTHSWVVPFSKHPVTPSEYRQATKVVFAKKIRALAKEETALSPTLEKLRYFAEQQDIDWVDAFLSFLDLWQRHGTVLLDTTDSLPYPSLWSVMAPDATILSLELLSESIDPSFLDPTPFREEILHQAHPFLTLETPLIRRYQPIPPRKQWEERKPATLLLVEVHGRQEFVTLGYDLQGKDLWWPILDGKYLMAFRPQEQPIPHRIRIREANEINHLGDAQAWSYQALGSINGEEDLTLSMNNVHQTPDGYRFYLSHLHESVESNVSSVRLVVNYDPFKQFLTYPGGVILALGTFALLFRRREGLR